MEQLRLSLLLMSAKTYTLQSPLVTAIKPAFHSALSHYHVNNTDKRTQHASYFLIPFQSPAPSVRPTILPNSLKTHIKTASKSERPRQQRSKAWCVNPHILSLLTVQQTQRYWETYCQPQQSALGIE